MSRSAPIAALALFGVLVLADPLYAASPNRLVSVGSSQDSFDAVIAGNGRYVVFRSAGQLYRRDMVTGVVTLVSAAAGTGAGNNDSYNQVVSTDGRYVAFESLADNLVANDTNGAADVFLRDVVTGTTTLVSRRHASYGGGSSTAAGASATPSISSNGQFIAFTSAAASTDLLPAGADTNGVADVYVFDRNTAALELISKRTPTALGNGASTRPFISGDGSKVVFQSDATNLTTNADGNGQPDVFVWDRALDATSLVSITHSNTAGNGQSAIGTTTRRAISDNGTFLVFESFATNLGATDVNGTSDVFLRDLTSGTTTLLSHPSGSVTTTANGTSANASISSDGSTVVFESDATNLTPFADANGLTDLFVFSRISNVVTGLAAGQIRLVTHNSASPNTVANDASSEAVINSDGTKIAFVSLATNLVTSQSDSNGLEDVFVSDVLLNANSVISHPTTSTVTTGNGVADRPDISLSGSYVAYESQASNLVAADANGKQDVFISGTFPAINLVKRTNGTDNNSAPGPSVLIGSTVTFTYTVTNPGDVPLSSVVVQDDNGTPGNAADDFNATFTGGDTNVNGMLDTTETWTFTASRIAAAGQYTNTATVTGQDATFGAITDSDSDNYFGVPPFGPPPNFSATMVSETDVSLSWGAVFDATGYEIDRTLSIGSPFTMLAIVGTTSFDDVAVSADTTYLYKVRAIDANSQTSAFTAIDAATTTLTDVVNAGLAVNTHQITQLRTATNAMRAAAALPAQSFIDSPLAAGQAIKALHVTQLRTALNEARNAIGLPPLTYTDPNIVTGSTLIKATHILELREGVR